MGRVAYDIDNPKHQGPTACCNLVIHSVMLYFFYTYGWKNPDLDDHGDCWAVDDKDLGLGYKFDDDYINVSRNMTTWF